MKTSYFKTSKGRFMVIDVDSSDCFTSVCALINGADYLFRLSDVTEEQAGKVVADSLDMGFFNGTMYYKDYSGIYGNIKEFDDFFESAIESLNSLLKSKGIHLYENPAPTLHHSRLEMESKTFYNPYIFKINEEV